MAQKKKWSDRLTAIFQECTTPEQVQSRLEWAKACAKLLLPKSPKEASSRKKSARKPDVASGEAA